MSVHGEYERSLENLILHLDQLPSESGHAWVKAFGALRMNAQPDLSTASRECLALIDRILREIPALSQADDACGTELPHGNILGESASHLRAHCQAILGVSDFKRT